MERHLAGKFHSIDFLTIFLAQQPYIIFKGNIYKMFLPKWVYRHENLMSLMLVSSRLNLKKILFFAEVAQESMWHAVSIISDFWVSKCFLQKYVNIFIRILLNTKSWCRSGLAQVCWSSGSRIDKHIQSFCLRLLTWQYFTQSLFCAKLYIRYFSFPLI